jgi:hypothetical protein
LELDFEILKSSNSKSAIAGLQCTGQLVTASSIFIPFSITGRTSGERKHVAALQTSGFLHGDVS